ncbi:MAG: putative metal-dependent hydrolase [Yoonia sp.]
MAHLTEMNHSRHFWALLDTYDTNRVAHEAALDEMTAEIMRVGRGLNR